MHESRNWKIMKISIEEPMNANCKTFRYNKIQFHFIMKLESEIEENSTIRRNVCNHGDLTMLSHTVMLFPVDSPRVVILLTCELTQGV